MLNGNPHGAGGEALELTGQVTTFIMTIGTGILLGVLFDCYRVLRGAFAPKAVMTWFTDLLYWLIATAVVFISLVLSNWGELRFYVFIGIISGLGLYYKWLSFYLIRLVARGVCFIILVLRFLKRIVIIIVVRPIVYCMRMVSCPFQFLWHQLVMWCRMRWIKPADDEKK